MDLRRYALVIVLLCGTLAATAAPEITVELPDQAEVGRPVPICITSSRPLSDVELPQLDGARWLPSRQERISRVNGAYRCTLVFNFVPRRTGTLKLPPLHLTADGERAATPERELTVVAAAPPQSGIRPEDEGGVPPPNQAVSGQILVPGDGKFYVGQEFPLTFRLLVREDTPLQDARGLKITGAGDLVFAKLNSGPHRDHRFLPPRTGVITVKGRRYRATDLTALVRAVKPGQTRLGAVSEAVILRRESPRGSLLDDFFSMGFGMRQQTFEIDYAPSPELNFQPLPPPPAGVQFLGLAGEWRTAVKLSQDQAKVGEPVELTLTLTGSGSGEGLTPPDVQLPGFRVYPPEVKSRSGTVQITYALIPLAAGERRISLKTATFSPAAGKYQTSDFNRTLPVAAGTGVVPDAVSAPSSPPDPDAGTEETGPALDYLKEDPGSVVRLPLADNVPAALLWSLLGSVPAALLLRWLHRRAERRAADPGRAARLKRRRELPALLKKIRREKAPDPELRRQVLDHLAGVLDLSPGATAEETAGRLTAPEDQQLVRELAGSEFRPGGGRALAASDRKRLLRLLKRLSVVLLLLSGLALEGKSAFNAAFESGDLQAAAAEYQHLSNFPKPHPHALYNLGLVRLRQGDLPRAQLALLRASLLAPQDRETANDLDYVRRQLFQQQDDRSGSFLNVLTQARDHWRPDHYLDALIVAVILLILNWGLAPMLGRRTFWSAAALLLAAGIAAAVALTTELAGPYSPSRALVVAPKLELRRIPTGDAKVEATLPGGSAAMILRRRDGWLRVEVNGRTGWARADEVQAVLPYTLFSREPLKK